MKKKSKAFALVETLIVSTIIASILIYMFVQFNRLEDNYSESFKYNDVDDLYKLDSIKEYVKSLDSESIINIASKINDDDIIIMDKNDDTYTNIEYFDNQVDLLNNLDIKTLVLTKADINNVDTSNLSKTLKNMIKKIDNKSNNYRIIAEFDNGECATITVNFEYVLYDGNGSEYTPVEYLESTGTQYIDTGYIATANTRLKIEYLLTDNPSDYQGIFYNSKSRTQNSSVGISKYQSIIASEIGNFRVETPVEVNKKQYTYISKEKIVVNDEIYINNNEFTYSNTSNNKGTSVFASTWSNTNYIYYIKAQLYYLKIYDNDTPVRDYVPVIDSNSRPCLFDKVGKVCYYNQGTGEFLYG